MQSKRLRIEMWGAAMMLILLPCPDLRLAHHVDVQLERKEHLSS